LRADQQRQQTADEQEDQRREQELDADDLVVGREDVFADETHFGVFVVGFDAVGVAGAHARSSLAGGGIDFSPLSPAGRGERSHGLALFCFSCTLRSQSRKSASVWWT